MPETVLVWVGVNDMDRGVSATTFEPGMTDLLRALMTTAGHARPRRRHPPRRRRPDRPRRLQRGDRDRGPRPRVPSSSRSATRPSRRCGSATTISTSPVTNRSPTRSPSNSRPGRPRRARLVGHPQARSSVGQSTALTRRVSPVRVRPGLRHSVRAGRPRPPRSNGTKSWTMLRVGLAPTSSGAGDAAVEHHRGADAVGGVVGGAVHEVAVEHEQVTRLHQHRHGRVHRRGRRSRRSRSSRSAAGRGRVRAPVRGCCPEARGGSRSRASAAVTASQRPTIGRAGSNGK